LTLVPRADAVLSPGVVLLIALTVVLDGLDNQMLGLAAPLCCMNGACRAACWAAFCLGFVGMALGTLAAGQIGDTRGRRVALLLGVAVFGWRRWRQVCRRCGSWRRSRCWPVSGWAACRDGGGDDRGVHGRALAQSGGDLRRGLRFDRRHSGRRAMAADPARAGLALAVLVQRGRNAGGGAGAGAPAAGSPGFLARHPARRAELERVWGGWANICRLRRGRKAAPLTDLLRGDLARSTLGLSTAMLSGMFLVYLMFNWAPTMLAAQGFALRDTSLGLTFYNIGGTTGALLAALAIMGLGRALRCRCWPGWRCWSAPFWLFFPSARMACR
jgi:AAHS family 4-hydroxybenzoate transporter-like MFS transporter